MADKITNQTNSTNQLISNDIKDELTLVNPNVSPIVSHIFRGGRTGTTTSTTIEWVDHYERRTTTALKAQLAAEATEITVEDADVLVKDALLSIGDEIVKITSVTIDEGKATIERGYAGTEKTTGAIAVGTTVQSLGIEMEEGGDLKPSTTKLPVRITNNTGIIYESYEITETAKHVNAYGQSGLSARELESQKKKDELLGIMENKLINGVKFVQGKSRQSAGIKQLIKEHGIVVDAKKKEISVELLNDVVKQIVAKGNPGAASLKAGKYSLCVPWDVLVKINALNKDTVRTGIKDTVTGTEVTEIVTAAGRLTVFPAPSLLEKECLLVNLNDINLKMLYPIKEEQGAKTSLADTYFIHGEYVPQILNLPFQVHIKNLK